MKKNYANDIKNVLVNATSDNTIFTDGVVYYKEFIGTNVVFMATAVDSEEDYRNEPNHYNDKYGDYHIEISLRYRDSSQYFMADYEYIDDLSELLTTNDLDKVAEEWSKLVEEYKDALNPYRMQVEDEVYWNDPQGEESDYYFIEDFNRDEVLYKGGNAEITIYLYDDDNDCKAFEKIVPLYQLQIAR